MTNPKHTPEPWKVVININDKSTYAIDGSNPRSRYVADDLLEADADRIVACVNAMAGIEDPQLLRETMDYLVPKQAEDRRELQSENDKLFTALKNLVHALKHRAPTLMHPSIIHELVEAEKVLAGASAAEKPFNPAEHEQTK